MHDRGLLRLPLLSVAPLEEMLMAVVLPVFPVLLLLLSSSFVAVHPMLIQVLCANTRYMVGRKGQTYRNGGSLLSLCFILLTSLLFSSLFFRLFRTLFLSLLALISCVFYFALNYLDSFFFAFGSLHHTLPLCFFLGLFFRSPSASSFSTFALYYC